MTEEHEDRCADADTDSLARERARRRAAAVRLMRARGHTPGHWIAIREGIPAARLGNLCTCTACQMYARVDKTLVAAPTGMAEAASAGSMRATAWDIPAYTIGGPAIIQPCPGPALHAPTL